MAQCYVQFFLNIISFTLQKEVHQRLIYSGKLLQDHLLLKDIIRQVHISNCYYWDYTCAINQLLLIADINWTCNMTGATSGAEPTYPSTCTLTWFTTGFLVGFMLLDLQFSVYCFVGRFFFWPLYCLSFDLSILITPLVSSNSSYHGIPTQHSLSDINISCIALGDC